ncbi:hypothetical protein PR202_gb21808 [Eleusine coracana subsp. coracana]|uniref:Uncharacterized protein n=1 Tax=Eleusine coracana subsp. coracana TaxID=191504 RepID=A0AAV5FF01_ELECO|nr:hypothetical protein PR202_gb21808 [Eleusine coracana subsp. coracana]
MHLSFYRSSTRSVSSLRSRRRTTSIAAGEGLGPQIPSERPGWLLLHYRAFAVADSASLCGAATAGSLLPPQFMRWPYPCLELASSGAPV